MSPEDRPDIPLDLVVVADFGLEGGHPGLGRIRRLESDGLPSFLADARPSVTIDSGGVPVSLSVSDARGFRPEAVAPQLPEARALLELRERLTQRGIRLAELQEIVAGLGDRSPLKRALSGIVEGGASKPAAAPAPAPQARPAASPGPAQPAAAAPGAAPGGDLDALFAMVDTGDSAHAATDASRPSAEATVTSTSSTRALDRLVHLLGIGGGSGQSVTTATQQGLAGAVDETLAETLRPALRDPRFQALEQTWSGLRFLMRRLDHRSGVRVHVLPVRRADLAKHFRETFVPFAEDQRREARVVVAIVDFDLGAEADLDLAADLCAAAAAIRTPVLAGLDLALLGVASFAEVERIDDLSARLADPPHAAWSALRAREASRWLLLAG